MDQKMEELREAENETFKRQKASILKEHNLIEAETQKILSQIDSETSAKVKSIVASGELEAIEVQSETRIMKSKIKAEGRAKAN